MVGGDHVGNPDAAEHHYDGELGFKRVIAYNVDDNGVPQPASGHTISTANSSAALLGAAETFTGEWEDVTTYTTVATAVFGSIVTDGILNFDLSTDNGATFTSVPSTVSDANFAVPRVLNVVEQYVRIRYVNGTTPMTGTFSLTTKYSLTYLTNNLNISESNVDEFVYFVEDNGFDKNLMKNGNELKFLEFLIDQSRLFKNIKNEKD